MKIKQLFSFFRFDIFNHQFFLRIGHKNQNSTIFSTIISHLLMITLVVYFIFSSFSTFLHTNPQVNIQDFDVTTRSSVHLSSENFRFAFRFENNLGNSINITNLSNYFDITATYIVQDHDTLKENPVWETQSEISFTFEHCVREKFLDFPEYYQTNLRDAFCLTDHSMDLSGFWDEIKLSYLYITINICDEEDPLCVGRGAIEEMFQGYYLTFYIETQNIDSNNYKNPSKQSMKYYSYIFDTNIKKNVNFYIKEVELKTFDALFFNLNPSSQKFFRQNSLDLDFNSNFINITNNTLNAFWEIYMHSSNQKQVIERTYSTLTAVFASVGGISKFLLMIGTFITLYYNEMKLQSELLNQLFLFNFEENSEVMKNSFRKKRKKNYFEKGKKLVNLGKETPETNILNHKMKKKDLDFSAVNEINLLDYTRNKNEKSLNENELKIDSHEKKSITNLNDLKQLDISKESLANNNLDKHFINLSDEDIKEVANEEFDKEIKFFRIHRAIIGKKTSTNPNISDLSRHKLCLMEKNEFEMVKFFTDEKDNKEYDQNKNKREQKNENKNENENENKNKNENDKENENENENEKENEKENENEKSNENKNINEIKIDYHIKEDKEKKNIEEKNILDNHLNQILRKLDEAKSSHKNKIKFTFWEIIRSIFFPFFLPKEHEKKLLLYKKGSGDLLKYINIFQIVQMLQQLEKLKLIIFNKNQLALFNYLSKPMVSLDSLNLDSSSPKENENYDDFTNDHTSRNKLGKILKYLERGNKKEQFKDIIRYHNELLETGAYSEFDEKLFDLLDDDLRTVLYHFNQNILESEKIKGV